MESRISKARLRLLYAMPFFGSLVSRLEIRVEEEGVGTAYVVPSGRLVLYRKYMNQLSDEELAWLLSHEVLHVALAYWARMGGREAQVFSEAGLVPLWNVAHDYAINLILEQAFAGKTWVKAPAGVLLDPKYKDWSAEEIYDQLLKDSPNLTGFLSDCRGLETSDVETTEWRQHLYDAFQEHKERGMGSLPKLLQVLLDGLAPQVSWVEQLSRWVGDNYSGEDYTYRRPSRRAQATNMVLPSISRSQAPTVTVLWDTSGSMSPHLEEVVRELGGILGALRAPIKVILCDAEVVGEFESLRDLSDLEVSGGGGSDFRPAFKRVGDPRSIIIAFTDGFITVPDAAPEQPVLWVLTPGGDDPTGGRWGEVIQLGAGERV